MKEIQGTLVLETLEEITDPKHTALLVIDVQNCNSSPKGFVASQGGDISWAREVVPRIKTVLQEGRRLGILIIFMKLFRSRDGSLESAPRLRLLERSAQRWAEHFKSSERQPTNPMYIEGTWDSEVLDELEPRPNERQIIKYLSSSFIGTPLDLILRNRGIKAAVVVGMVTEGCVESTVRDLEQYGYYPVILNDCVWSSRRDLHEAALLVMSARYEVVSSEEILRVWRSGSA